MNPVAHGKVLQRESAGRSKVTRASRKDLYGIVRIGATVPEKKPLRGVAFGGVQFFAQYAAAQVDSSRWIAKATEVMIGEAIFAGDLSHHLHQAPGHSARVSFRRGDLIICI